MTRVTRVTVFVGHNRPMLPAALYECLPFVCLLIGAFAWIAPAPLVVRTLSTFLFLIGAYVLWLRLFRRRSGPQ